ncbi:unnamed protein product [Linum trigynum]|uniref:Uncharacterized protein n=1 Tax=Linum trigynum TaxID=586398 RepID=A0AAV2D6U3_9ROSI
MAADCVVRFGIIGCTRLAKSNQSHTVIPCHQSLRHFQCFPLKKPSRLLWQTSYRRRSGYAAAMKKWSTIWLWIIWSTCQCRGAALAGAGGCLGEAWRR